MLCGMNLKTYVDKERGRASAIAAAIGVNPVMVSQWTTGVKQVPVERCYPIEAATGHAVMRWDLRPGDWHRIWPELIGMKGAPRPFAKGGAVTTVAAPAKATS